MIPLVRAAVLLALLALGACAEQRHPLDGYLAQLRPDAPSALPGMAWPAGTLLCPLAPYQNELHGAAPLADRVNAFLKQKRFQGDEGHWSLVVVKPVPAGDAGIEQLVFKRGDYDVINDPQLMRRDALAMPAGFAQQACVSVEQARVLATRTPGSGRKVIVFGSA